MPAESLRAPGHSRARSLGWLAVAWMEHFCIHGPGDIQGKPLRELPLSTELAALTVDCYALDESGRRMYDSAFYSRPKGADKSGHAARIGMFEALGPCRFGGWANGGEVFEWLDFRYTYEPGEPMGRPVTYPFLRILATEEGQTGNVYDSIHFNFKEGPLSEAFSRSDDVGLTRVFLPGGGEIRPSTASSSAKDGGKETWANFDEALALDTPLPTPTGWTTMGEVQVGDRLIGADGTPVNVTKVTDIMEQRDCYRVTFADGSSLVASAGHLWHAKPKSTQQDARVWTTEEMFATGWAFRVPASGAWDLPARDLDIDPYVLGLWLGDGDARNATITVGDQDVEETTANIEAVGYTVNRLASGVHAPLLYVSLPGSHRNRFSPERGLKVRLRDAGLLQNKHIPPEYLRASHAQRLALLSGLMDSDGHIAGGTQHHCTFVNTSKPLVDGIVELLRSLGELPRVRFVTDVRSRAGGYFQVHFTPRSVSPFRLSRKAARVRMPTANVMGWTTIASIERVESVPVRCVAVDAADHLFLAGPGAHVTHNTHLYTLPELRRMYATVRRNLAKRRESEPWSFESSTMYEPGLNSVAEATHLLVQSIKAGRAHNPRVLFDHRQAPVDWNVNDDAALIAGLQESYGDAASYMDFERLKNEIRDPRNEMQDSLRYYGNVATAGAEVWLPAAEWTSRSKPGYVPPEGALITLGFDGSTRRDSTALVGTEVETGVQFVLGIWERDESVTDWEIDYDDVEQAVDAAFERYEVWRMYCDPRWWETRVARWAGKYGDRRVVEWPTNRPRQMAYSLLAYRNAITEGEISNDGHPVMAQHIANAVRHRENFYDERGNAMVTIRKERQDSPRKIDAVMAGCLSDEARRDALTSGVQGRADWVVV